MIYWTRNNIWNNIIINETIFSINKGFNICSIKITTRIKWNKFISLFAIKYITTNVILFICIKINFFIIFDIVKSSAFFKALSSIIKSFKTIFSFFSSFIISVFISVSFISFFKILFSDLKAIKQIIII